MPSPTHIFNQTTSTGSPELDQHLALVRNVDWSSTSIGPIESWPAALIQVAHVVMLEKQPRLLLLGEQNHMLYNPAYAQAIAGDKHPEILGMTETAAWPIQARIVQDKNKLALLVNEFTICQKRGGRSVDSLVSCVATQLPFCPKAIHVSFASDSELESELPVIKRRSRTSSYDSHRSDGGQSSRPNNKGEGNITERLSLIQKIVDAVDVGLFQYLPDGTLAEANDAYHTLSGIPRARINEEQHPFLNYLYPADRDYVVHQWNELAQGKAVTFEMRWKVPMDDNGEDFRWVLAACESALDAEGNVASIYGCITDIHHQKQAELQIRARMQALEKLKDSEMRFQSFLEHAPVAVVITNAHEDMTYANSNWFELTGTPKITEWSIPQPKIPWNHLVHKHDRQDMIAQWSKLSLGVSIHVEFRLRRPAEDGTGPIWVQARAWPSMDADGNLKTAIGTLVDVTHFKHSENQHKLQVAQATEARRQQENFVDMTSHEIRNPLSATLHCADALTEYLDEVNRLVAAEISPAKEGNAKRLHGCIQEALDAVNTIKTCATHQKRIVDDILVLSKLDSNLLKVSPTKTRAIDILQSTAKIFEAEAKAADVDLITQGDESLQKLEIDWLLLDLGRIDQILINLVTNAVKFTKNRETRNVSIRMGISRQRPSEADLGVDSKVDFSLSQSLRDSVFDAPDFAGSDLFLWFCVSDTGRGMTPEEKGRIFARFQQASHRTYSEYGGSGLGLFISHSLAGLQGGEIGVASEAGVGSTFAFFVKTSRCEAPDDDRRTIPRPPSAKPTNTVESLTRLTIHEGRTQVLIVEDNLLNQKVLKKQLGKYYDIYTADHGQEALDFIRTTRHWNAASNTDQISLDMILMDIEMPVMGGLECSRRIRDFEANGQLRAHIPIIAVSANARPEQIKQSIDAGMEDAITKPFRIPDLIPKIDRLVRKAGASVGY